MTAPDATSGPADAPDVAETEQADSKPKASAEAARYRRQLRDAEAERDSLRERITGYERAEAERIAADVLADPADMWAAGTQLDELRGEDGTLDRDKLGATLAAIIEQRPHWRRPTTPKPDPRQGGGHADSVRSAQPWHDALSNRHRR